MGINLKYDFYDIVHTNVHGSLKYTDYVISALMNKYGIEEGKKDAADFNKALKKYLNNISPYVLDIELDPKERDYKLDRPELISAVNKGENVEIAWKSVEEADGYSVYRKNNNVWQFIGETEDCRFSDTNRVYDSVYTVVSYHLEGDRKLYGYYDCKGIEVS